MAFDGTGKIYIDGKAWTDFLIEQAPFLKHTEFAIRPHVEFNGDGIEVEFACSTDCHPADWSERPWWVSPEGK